MLSQVLKQHQAEQQERKSDNERRRKEVLAAANAVSHAMMSSLTESVSKVFNNQKLLEFEAKKLQQQSVTFQKNSGQWLQMIDSFNGALKELGDVENWAKIMETDMQNIAVALQEVEKEKEKQKDAMKTETSTSGHSPSTM
eukprot:Nk52_evm6s304 gene=Nk52_evmTU6s304